jgi:2,4-dienoyl-CoA reductase-like NADH-dependent reductase (Old Yellow Enzyme family)
MLLFQPIRIGNLRVQQRTWVPAMVPWRATEDGYVTAEVREWYARFARGRPGVLVVEATGIRDIPSGPLLRIGHDRFLPGLRELVEIVRRESAGQTRFLIQIIDFLTIRRRPEKDKYFLRFLQLEPRHRHALSHLTAETSWLHCEETALRSRLAQASEAELDQILSPRELEDYRFGYRERVTDLHLQHICDLPKLLPELFAAAAARAQQCGFDGVELHYAHAYTMASFLSRHNTRPDSYGGSLENRVRLPLEVYRAVRQRVGDYVVGVRFLADEAIEGGSPLEDAIHFGTEFARAGFDYLSLSKGGKFEDAKQPKVGWAAYPYTGRSGYECMPTVISDQRGPFGRNVPLAAAIRAALRQAGLTTPVVTAGGISNAQQAEAILQRGEADLIAAARQSLADPDWFRKTLLGHGDQVRRCVFTNYCEGLDQHHKMVTCKLWDRVDLDAPGASRTPDGTRRLSAPEWKAPEP